MLKMRTKTDNKEILVDYGGFLKLNFNLCPRERSYLISYIQLQVQKGTFKNTEAIVCSLCQNRWSITATNKHVFHVTSNSTLSVLVLIYITSLICFCQQDKRQASFKTGGLLISSSKGCYLTASEKHNVWGSVPHLLLSFCVISADQQMKR